MQSDCGEKEYPLLQIKVFVVKFNFQACVEVSFDFFICIVPVRNHTLVLDSSGQLWAFGSGERGQIGTGQRDNILTPTLVKLPWTRDRAATPTGLFLLGVE